MNKNVLIVVVLLVIGVGIFLATGKDEATNNENQVVNTSQAQNTAESEDSFADSQLVSIAAAIDIIGMTCSGSATESECSYNDVDYTLSQPEDWEADRLLRRKACTEGIVNPGYDIVTDGSTWYFTTDNAADSDVLGDVLADLVEDSAILKYCS